MLSRLKDAVKRVLAIRAVRRLHQATMHAVLELLGAHRALSLVYSLASIPAFNREQFAVLRGQRNYYRRLRRPGGVHPGLRRNVHRLEKGILMQPRRRVFALDYIEETLDFYLASVEARDPSDEADELRWAHDVLARYFDLVDPSFLAVVDARRRYDASRAAFEPGLSGRVPYRHADRHAGDASFDSLLSLARQRRSTRWFLERGVPRACIDRALEVAVQAPSACNRLPYEFLVFDEPALVREISSIPFGTAGYAHQIPVIAVVVGKLDHYFSARDRHAIYIDGSLAAMSFVLALETQGLSSSIINWPDFEPLERRMQRAVGLAYDERVLMLIAIGYADPDGLVAYSQKKPLDGVRRYNPRVYGIGR